MITNLDQDIFYGRRHAEQGRRGFITGGFFLGTAGLVFGCACVGQWAIMRGYLAANLTPYLWLGTFVLYAAIWANLFLRLRARNQPDTVNASHTAFSVLWMGCAAGIVSSVAAIAIVAHVTGIASVELLIPPLVFCFYGVAWFVVGMLARRTWMQAVALASFASALALAALSGDARELLVMAAALVLTLTVPGFKLTSEEPR